jgi:hypothetical protein
LEKIALVEFHGIVHYETIGELIHQFKVHVHNLGIHIGTYKKVLLVMIETLENIMKYGAAMVFSQPEGFGTTPAFTIIKEGERYLVHASNALPQQEIPQLEKRLAYLNTLSPQGIKDLYKDTITNGEFTKHGGAGLGLIEIAKISGNRLDYDFTPINESFSNFRIRVVIDEFPAYPAVSARPIHPLS